MSVEKVFLTDLIVGDTGTLVNFSLENWVIKDSKAIQSVDSWLSTTSFLQEEVMFLEEPS